MSNEIVLDIIAGLEPQSHLGQPIGSWIVDRLINPYGIESSFSNDLATTTISLEFRYHFVGRHSCCVLSQDDGWLVNLIRFTTPSPTRTRLNRKRHHLLSAQFFLR